MLGLVDKLDLEHGIAQNASELGEKRKLMPFICEAFRRGAEAFWSYCNATRRILPLYALRSLESQWGFLRNRAFPEVKFVSRRVRNQFVNKT